MDREREVLIKLLSAAIRGQDIEEIDCDSISWTKVYKEAEAHEVHTLIYPIVNSLALKNIIDDGLMRKWNRNVIISQAQQVRHIYQISEVFKSFNTSGISAIALKGLVLRNLYPNPDLRTMGDADIFVHKEDMKRSINILLEMGYYIIGSDSRQIHFSRKGHSKIELHSMIVNYGAVKKVSYLEALLWENSVQYSICGIPVLRLSDGDEILHLCLHLAAHIKSYGFGLRQLCDLVLAVESSREKVDWKSFYDKCRTYGIYRLVDAVFTICSRLFKMILPCPTDGMKQVEECYVDMLVDYIFDGGNCGVKLKEREIASVRMLFSKDKEGGQYSSWFFEQLYFIFPSPERLTDRYSYARKYHILTPLAWVHRFLYCLIRKDLTPSQKKGYMIPTDITKSIIKQKSKLLNWLQLE